MTTEEKIEQKKRILLIAFVVILALLLTLNTFAHAQNK